MRKGIIFSFEACVSCLVFLLILLTMPSQPTVSLKELALFQQENDLLRVWSSEYPSYTEIEEDLKKLFLDAEVFVDSRRVAETGKEKANSIASEAIIIDSYLTERKFKLIVYYE